MRFASILSRLWANWITLLGSVITTVSGFALLLLLVVALASPTTNPYQLYVLIALPVFLAIGLVLIPIGLYVERRRSPDRPKDALQLAFDAAFAERSARNRIIFVAVATVANIALFAFAGQKTLAHMNSPQFCGTQCHTPMQPEWDAWNRSPHSNVACVDCHIGPGASGEIKAKWNGIHQLVGVVTSKYDRPITAMADSLPPANVTCEQCHSPQRFKSDHLRLFAHYDLDKDNTPKFNAMLLRTGGLNRRTEKYEGIHWHANPDNQVKFEYLDAHRRKIGKITLLTKGQVVAEYLPPGEPQKPLGVRTMDCIDCHNRPTHVFDGTPKNAVDRAIFLGALDRAMPFIAEVSVGLLTKAAVPREQADEHFKTAIAAAYQKDHPDVKADPAALEKAAKTLAVLYRRNVYPAMNLGWNQYRSNLVHKVEGDSNAGCFRCHDNQRVATLADGRKKKLSQSCDFCHTGLAFDENPDKFDDTLSALMPAAN